MRWITVGPVLLLERAVGHDRRGRPRAQGQVGHPDLGPPQLLLDQ